jgi:amidase
MTNDPNRRSFLKEAGAASVAGSAAAPPAAATIPTPLASPPGSPYRTATELVEALANRTVSSRQLVDNAIARIEALDTKINAVVVRDFTTARQAADAADQALARGERRPLLGLPMTVKEQFNTSGLPTTWGDPKFKDWQPAGDALAVTRLKTAGAVILGKTNVPLQLADWQTYNQVYGTTNNPWDLTRTPGGSSGGSAAALAGGFVALELGSDIGGSLRAPAHFCGVFSHKPSLDLVPQRGAGPPETPAIPMRIDLAVAGPMARSAADLALGLSVLAGPDEMTDAIGYKLALPPARHGALKDFRVLVIDTHPLCPTAGSVTGALDRLAQRLQMSGCAVSRGSPRLPDLAATTRLYVKLLLAFFSVDLPADLHRQVAGAAKALSADDESLAACRLRGLTISFPDWVHANRVRAGMRMQWQSLFQDFDVVLCPPMPTVAFPHDHSPQLTRQLDIDGKLVSYDDQIVWASMATLFGLPATTAPIDRSETGLPIGVQIISGYLEDHTTIAFARLIEHEYGGFVPPPEL